MKQRLSTWFLGTCGFTLWLHTTVIQAADTTSASPAPRPDLMEFSRLALGLAMVLIIFFALAWAAKKFNVTGMGKSNTDLLKVIAALPVGARERVVLLEADGERLLVGITANRIETLHTFSADQSVANTDFASVLENSTDRKDATR